MKAMIFSAGLGTRFKPWTDKHPKALAVVNGKTLLQRNIEYLQQYGIDEVVVNVHHFAEQVIAAIEENNGWGSRVMISDERSELLETGGGLLHARSMLQGSPFITINVDVLCNIQLTELINAHHASDNLITLAVADRETTRFLLFNKALQLCGWRNLNPMRERIVLEAEHYLQKAYSGIAVFQPKVFNLIAFTGKFSLIDVYLDLAVTHPIRGFDHTGDKFIDVGKPGSVTVAESLFD